MRMGAWAYFKRRTHRNLRALTRPSQIIFVYGFALQCLIGITLGALGELRGDLLLGNVLEGISMIMLGILPNLMLLLAGAEQMEATRRRQAVRWFIAHHIGEAKKLLGDQRLANTEFIRAKTLEAYRRIEQHARKIHGEGWKMPPPEPPQNP